jgi:hypothetical protein
MSQETRILQHLDKKCWTPKICASAIAHDPNNYDYCCQAVVSADGNTSLLNKEAWIYHKYCCIDGDNNNILDGIDKQYITPDVASIALRYNPRNVRYIPNEILTDDMIWYVLKNKNSDEIGYFIMEVPKDRLIHRMLCYVLQCHIISARNIPGDILTEEMIWYRLKNDFQYTLANIHTIPKYMIDPEMRHYINQKTNPDKFEYPIETLYKSMT